MDLYSHYTREETLKHIAKLNRTIDTSHPDLRCVRIAKANLSLLYAHLTRLKTK